MLESLLIRNIALFEEARIDFGPGLHVLTGETGAGKSLVVDAVNFLCGAKTDKSLIRTGSEKAYVEGLFSLDNLPAVIDILQQFSYDIEDAQLVLSRELSSKGRSVYRINGIACTLTIYQELTSRLIDLHGQHEHQSLLQENKQRQFLDLIGDAYHTALLQATSQAYAELSAVKKEYETALAASRSRMDRVEILILRQKELKNARLESGEDERLQEERDMLRNAEKIAAAIREANEAIFEANDKQTALSLLDQAHTALDRISSYGKTYAEFSEKLQNLYYELEDIGRELSTHTRGIYQDDRRLEEVENRLDFLRKLQRKYGPTTQEMLETLTKTEEELEAFESLDDKLECLSKAVTEKEHAYHKAASALSQSRQALARQCACRIEEVLHELNMSSTRFYIRVDADLQAVQAEGYDRIVMMIAPNAGEEPMPLSLIASGGELSRVMLAMKTLSAEKNEVPTMVFDEIDTGVSGQTAMVLAKKLWSIARFRQVICVSHLHQLAAMASSQYQVSKQEVDGRTLTSVSLLDEEARVQEIAKMLGNIRSQGETSVHHARVLLEDAAALRISDGA